MTDICYKEKSISTKTATAPQPLPLCRFDDVELKYGAVTAVTIDELEIKPGTLTAVVGPSGSGKTTLTTAIGNIPAHNLTSVGHVHRHGKVGLISQDAFGALNPLQRVDRQIALTAGSIERAHELLAKVHLAPEFFSRYPLELSGGQRQRAAIAFALGSDPDLLLCDEITSALDPVSTAGIVRTLREIVESSEGSMSIVFISHDLGAARALCPDVITLDCADDCTCSNATFRKNWDDFTD
ncbi:MAG: ATP-binding cassette domain-containing protein [Corynebacterium sp.]|nr:ATP-binding cassette domain-containing protein [Corynebacterium sp.]